jgi:hypothetical protein
MSVENIYKLKTDYYRVVDDDGKIDVGTNMPGYTIINAVEPGTKELKHEFSRNIIEATINVEF